MNKQKRILFSITRLTFTFLLFTCFSFNSFSQDEEGFIELKFDTRTYSEKAPIEGVDIIVYANDKEVQKAKTDKRGGAKVELKYGSKYRVVFSKEGFVNQYMLLSSDIPQKKRITISKFSQSILFVSKAETKIDTVRFKHPFTKWYYDRLDNRFKENADYLKEFETGIFKEDAFAKQAAENEEAKQVKEKTEKDKKDADKQRHALMRAEYKKQKKIIGKVFSTGKTPKPIVGAKVFLFNANKQQIGITTTNALGGFAFMKNDKGTDGNIEIEVDGVISKYLAGTTEIAVTNNAGQELKRATKNEKGKFSFRFLSSEEKMLTELVINDADLKMDVQGQLLKSNQNKKQPLANLTVRYIDEFGNQVVSAITNANGEFLFKSLNNDAFYLFSIDEKDAQLKAGEKIILADINGNVVKEIQKEGAGAYNFEIISSEQNGLTTLFYDDPWLKVIDPSRAGSNQQNEMIIKEKVYFNSNDATLLPEAKRTLNEVANVMESVSNITVELSSHSDSKGSDDYNLALSKKRAKAAVDYIISLGISPTRISGIGYGETHLINKCANGVDCTEEEHAENRRLEFKVTRK